MPRRVAACIAVTLSVHVLVVLSLRTWQWLSHRDGRRDVCMRGFEDTLYLAVETRIYFRYGTTKEYLVQ